LRDVSNGLQITMPLHAAANAGHTGVMAPSSSQSVKAHSRRQPQSTYKTSTPTQAELAGLAAGFGSATSDATKRATPALAPALAVAPAVPTPEELALGQGVEIVEEDYPWPEKRADAAEGWWDNRGEFQYY